MAALVWAPRAYADLETIGAYHAESAPGYSEMLVRRLMQATERLTTFPTSGRLVPEIGDESLREVIHRNYRIIYMYLPEEDRVEVLTSQSKVPALHGSFSTDLLRAYCHHALARPDEGGWLCSPLLAHFSR